MAEPEIRVHADADTLADAVAAAFVEAVARPVSPGRTGAQVHEVALTGGSIARAIHRTITRLAPAAGVQWSRVRLWWGDERFVASDSENRNVLQAQRDMLDALRALPSGGLPDDNVMPVPSSDEVADVEAAADVYSDLLRHEGTGAFDLVMLGVGPDGHVASLFPGHPAAAITDRIAVAVRDSPKPPPERVSLTFEALERAERVWFVVAGTDKAEAVARALADEGSVTETPARGVRGRTETVWWLDREAAAALRR